MTRVVNRRGFLRSAATAGGVLCAAPAGAAVVRDLPGRLRLSCNLYSFNTPLTTGAMTLEDVLEFCATVGFDAVDPTGYYFTGYPAAPPDALVHRIKRRAFELGLAISGTGVRNDFAQSDPGRRDADVALIGQWTEVASKLGAPVLRVFDGRVMPQDRERSVVMDWIVDGLGRAVRHGEAHGVVIALQNHDDALKEASDYLEIRRRIPSAWFGLNVDIGSLRTTSDPYGEIARLAPHAVTWQVKEFVYRRRVEERVDLRAVMQILRESRYRGFIPIETLGAGDARIKVRRFADEVREAMARGL